MNYRTVIAFLGSKQQKDWGAPISEWVSIDEPVSGSPYGIWSESFPVQSARGKHTALNANKYPEFFKNYYGCWGNNMRDDGLKSFTDYGMTPDPQFPQFYNAAAKSIIFIEREVLGDKDKIFDFVDSHGADMIPNRSYSYEKAFKL